MKWDRLKVWVGLTLPVLIVLGGMQAAPAAAQPAETMLSLTPAQTTLAVGETFTLSLEIDSVPEVRAVQFGLEFDPGRICLQGVSMGGFFSDWILAAPAPNNLQTLLFPPPDVQDCALVGDTAVLVLGDLAFGGPSGSGVIADFHFLAVSAGAAEVNVTHVQVASADTDELGNPSSLPVEVLASEVVVQGDLPAPTATLLPTAAPPSRTPTAGPTRTATPAHLPSPSPLGPSPTPSATWDPAVPPPASIWIEAPLDPLEVGQSFYAIVMVDTTLPTRGFETGIQYDPAVLRCDSLQEGNFYRDWVAAQNQAYSGQAGYTPGSTMFFPQAIIGHGVIPTTGLVILGALFPDEDPQYPFHPVAPAGSGALMILRFTALAPGISDIQLFDTGLADARVDEPRYIRPLAVREAEVYVSGIVPVSAAPVVQPTPFGEAGLDAQFGVYLQVDPDERVELSLDLGPNLACGNLNVKSNSHYKVAVYDANPTAGRLAQHDGADFLLPLVQLSNPLTIDSAYTIAPLRVGSTAKVLLAGNVSGQNGDLGEDFPLTYGQVLTYADPLIETAGHTYQLVLTYHGYVTAD